MSEPIITGQTPAQSIIENVTRTTLPNGLTVLLKENHQSSVVALLVLVKVGYFHEPDKWNGIAHVIEHLLFKGTPTRPAEEQIAREVRELGGMLNASTYYEETNYYVVVPSQYLEQAMAIQSDALQNSTIDATALAKELEVIVQESLQKRDSPLAMLTESLNEIAFDQHRIRRWRIGHPETLRSFSSEDLKQFLQETYRPENMILTVVGDFDTDQALQLVNRYWGELPQGTLHRELSPSEPERTEFRYRRMMGSTKQNLFLMGFSAPPLLHVDAPALLVLSAILSDGRSALLYRRLKEELRLANSAWASYENFEQMGIFTLGAECIEADPLSTQQALWTTIETLKSTPIRQEELERIKNRIESRRLGVQEEVLGVARNLTSYEAQGDYHLHDTLLQRIEAVTSQDILRVAQHYLTLENAALLEYLPNSLELPERSPQELLFALSTTPPPTSKIQIPMSKIQEAPRELVLSNGAKLLYKRRQDLPLVALTVLFRGGKHQETLSTSGITNLMLKSSLKGTASFTAEEIANKIEGLGSGIGVSLASDYFGYGMKIQRNFLLEGFRLFLEVLTQPTFPEAKVDREKQSIYAEIRRQQDNNFSLAYDLFTAAYYGENHPYGLPAHGNPDIIAALTSQDLLSWHRQFITPENMVIALVGDISEEEAVVLWKEWEAECWVSGVGYRDNSPTIHSPNPPSERVLNREKQQTAVVLGFPGATIGSEDRYALDVLSEITSGMGGRFFRAVRGENALAYQVTSFHRSRQEAGNFVAYTSTAPESEARARELLLQEIANLSQEFVTPQELTTAKSAIVGGHVIGTQTFAAQAGELAGTAIYGLPLEEPQHYLERIQAVTQEDILAVAQQYLQPERHWQGIVRGGSNT